MQLSTDYTTLPLGPSIQITLLMLDVQASKPTVTSIEFEDEKYTVVIDLAGGGYRHNGIGWVPAAPSTITAIFALLDDHGHKYWGRLSVEDSSK